MMEPSLEERRQTSFGNSVRNYGSSHLAVESIEAANAILFKPHPPYAPPRRVVEVW